MGLDPFLPNIANKILIFEVFATRVRDGRASRSGRPVHAETVADEILFIPKAFTALGARDPRLNDTGRIDSRLTNLYRGMKDQDPAPNCVQPILIQLLHAATQIAYLAGDPASLACVDMAWIAFFYILCAGEYYETVGRKLFKLPVTIYCSYVFQKGVAFQ